MWFFNFGRRPRALAGGMVAFGIVLLITSLRPSEGAVSTGLALLGLALLVPAAVWLIADFRFTRPRGAWWWTLVALAAAVGVWGLTMFPGAADTPFGRPMWG